MVLDLALRALDRARDHLGFDRRFVGEPDAVHDALSCRSPPNRRISSSSSDDVEARAAGVALTAGTSAQLVVDAPRLVALGADDVQAADVGDAFAEHDVDAAAGHVGGDGHRAVLSGILDDLRLPARGTSR